MLPEPISLERLEHTQSLVDSLVVEIRELTLLGYKSAMLKPRDIGRILQRHSIVDGSIQPISSMQSLVDNLNLLGDLIRVYYINASKRT